MNYTRKRCNIKRELLTELVDYDKLDLERLHTNLAKALKIPKIFFNSYEDRELQENDFKRQSSSGNG